MKNQKNNKIHFCEEHYGKWVALSADRKKILDFSTNLSQLSSKFGTKDVVYTKPLDPNKSYAF